MSREGSLDRLIGQVLAARYRVGERLGEGAMGTVFRAQHVKVGRQLAVKVLHPRMLENEKYRRRFDREAELAGQLRHPNVAGVVDVGITPEGLRYLVMEFADGPTLAELIAEGGAMPAGRAVKLAKQLCDGLEHAHEHGLIHRDFKPDNVIVERDLHGDEVVRILDFGIAIAQADIFDQGERERLTTAGMVLGTPHYMAPEHASGQPIDHRIDLFALGVMCFEMLTGRLPFDGNGVEVARANLIKPIPAMAVRAPNVEVDPLLEAFTRALLAKSRDVRLASAKAARDLLVLIEKDRAAAAKVLGVERHDLRRTLPVSPAPPPGRVVASGSKPPPFLPWTDAPTEQMVPLAIGELPTEQMQPVTAKSEPPRQEERAGSIPGSEPRPAIGRSTPMPKILLRDPDASVSVYKARTPPPMAVRMERIDTETTLPVRVPRRRPLAPWLVAGGVAAIAVALLVWWPVRTKPRAVDAVPPPVIAETPPPTPSVAAPAPTPTPTPPAPTPTPTPPAPAPPVVRAQPAPAPPPVVRARPPAPAPTAAPTVVLRPPEVPAVTFPAVPVDAPIDPSTETLAQLYSAVGHSLKQLDAARGKQTTMDLWPRYLHIRINDALVVREKRIAAYTNLRFLEREIAQRGR